MSRLEQQCLEFGHVFQRQAREQVLEPARMMSRHLVKIFATLWRQIDVLNASVMSGAVAHYETILLQSVDDARHIAVRHH